MRTSFNYVTPSFCIFIFTSCFFIVYIRPFSVMTSSLYSASFFCCINSIRTVCCLICINLFSSLFVSIRLSYNPMTSSFCSINNIIISVSCFIFIPFLSIFPFSTMTYSLCCNSKILTVCCSICATVSFIIYMRLSYVAVFLESVISYLSFSRSVSVIVSESYELLCLLQHHSLCCFI